MRIIGKVLICFLFVLLPTRALMAQTRTSPFAPPEKNDTTFIVDDAQGLDTGCSFRSEGPLAFEIEVNRFVGEVNADGTLRDVNTLVTNGIISSKATLKLPAYDVDYDADISPYGNPERDVIKFNGVQIKRVGTNEALLTGLNDTWILNEFTVPIEIIKFPEKAQIGNATIPRMNTITIDIDQANTDLFWCTSVDWAALSFKAISPVVLIHGNNSDGGFFDRRGFTSILRARKIPFDNSINMPTSTVRTNGSRLNDYIPAIVKSFGVDSIHLVVHSKGGLDSREYLANFQPANDKNFKVLSYTSLSTPHNGSVLADLQVMRTLAALNASEVEFQGFPTFTKLVSENIPLDIGTINLTTDFTSAFNARNMPHLSKNIVINTVAADADQNNNGEIDRNPDEYSELRAESASLSNIDSVSHALSRRAVNIPYQILRNTGGITLTYRTESKLFGGTRVVATLTSIPSQTALGNDALVTIPSGQGEGSIATRTTNTFTFTGAQGRNHSSVANAGVASTVIPWIIEVERAIGDMKD